MSALTSTRRLGNFEFGNHTDVGLRREQNEDYLGYFDTPNGHVFVVADGMGGHVGGATASRLSVEAVRGFFEGAHYPDAANACRQALETANLMVHKFAEEHPELQGMGTTAVLVLVRGRQLWHAHVGDSRIYQLKAGVLAPITRDHSVVQEFVDMGIIQPDEMETHPRRNELTRALGLSPTVMVEAPKTAIVPESGTLFLMCTDGLNGYATHAGIQAVLEGPGDLRQKAIQLTELANAGGGGDNTTVQIIRFFDFEDAGSAAAAHGTQAAPAKPLARSLALLAAGVLVAGVTGFFVVDAVAPTDKRPADSVIAPKQDNLRRDSIRIDTTKARSQAATK